MTELISMNKRQNLTLNLLTELSQTLDNQMAFQVKVTQGKFPMKRRESGVAQKFSVGEHVGVICSIQQGPFPDEKLVTVETEDGEISGFVKTANLQQLADGSHGFVKGTVVAVEQDSIRVQINGSFFTTAAGIALIAKHQLSRLSAA